VVLRRRAGGRCECCGAQLLGKVDRHHRQRREVGGDRLANILLLLPDHHHYWHEHPAEARARGLIVSSYSPDPATVVVLHHGRRPSLLNDAGEVIPQTPTQPG